MLPVFLQLTRPMVRWKEVLLAVRTGHALKVYMPFTLRLFPLLAAEVVEEEPVVLVHLALLAREEMEQEELAVLVVEMEKESM